MRKKISPLLVLMMTVAISPSGYGQNYYLPLTLSDATKYSTYTLTNHTLVGDMQTGMVFFELDVFSRDKSVFENWRIDNVVDDNGNIYKSYLSEKDAGNIYTNVAVAPKGMFSSHQLVGGEVVVLPSSVKHLKEVHYAYGMDEEETRYMQNYYSYDWKVNASDYEIKWKNMCYERPQHPSEFYFHLLTGINEITSGTEVRPYSGRTIIKGMPICIHLTGCIGNKETGEVCFIFSVYGNADDDRLNISTLQAFDDDGMSYKFEQEFFYSRKKKGERIGRKYGPIEFCMLPFKVPVGTASFQKLKMSGSTDIAYNFTEVEFEWKDIPIQWISFKK